MAITFYYAPMSSASPVAWALAELDLAHEAVRIDLKRTEHKRPEFLALNPMGQVPTLVDNGQAMFESSAITIYLGEKYGASRGLWPAVGSAGHMVALTWIHWQAVTFGTTLRMIFASSDRWGATPEMQNKAQYERGIARLGELLGILDAHLATREYITGAEFTLADTFIAAGLGWATGVVGTDLAPFPHVAAYLRRSMSRPATAAMGR